MSTDNHPAHNHPAHNHPTHNHAVDNHLVVSGESVGSELSEGLQSLRRYLNGLALWFIEVAEQR